MLDNAPPILNIFPPFAHYIWMRLFYLQLRSFCLRFVFFTYGGGTVSKKNQIQFAEGGGNRKQKRPNLIPGGGNRKLKRPYLISTVSKEDQTVSKKTKPSHCKPQRPTVSKKDLPVSKKNLPIIFLRSKIGALEKAVAVPGRITQSNIRLKMPKGHFCTKSTTTIETMVGSL